MLHEAPPESLLPLLAAHGLTDPAPGLVTATDLAFDGRFDQEWLVVTPRHVAVVTEDEGGQVLRRLDPKAVDQYRACGGVGSGMLQARTDGHWVDLVRYSNSLAHRFHKVAARLEEFRKDGALVIHPEDNKDERRCPKCRHALAFAGDVCPRCINPGAIFGRMWELARPYRWAAFLMSALVLLGVTVELAPPKLQQYMVDHVLHVDDGSAAPRHLLGILLLIVGSLAATRVVLAVVGVAKGLLASRVGTAMTSDLRARLVDKLHALSVDYYDRHPVGVLMSRVAHDSESIYGLLHQFTSGFLLQILQVIGVGVMLFTLNPRLALWTIIPMPLVLYGSWFFWRYVYPMYYRHWEAASKQAGMLAGMLSGIRVVKAFGQESREAERFRATSNNLCLSRLHVETSSSTFSAVMSLVFSLGGLIVWYVGGRDVLGSRMTLGELMAFLAYLAMFYGPLSTLAQLTTWLTSFLTASQRVFELLDTPVQIRDPDKPVHLPQGAGGHIRLEKATFGYDANRPVLKEFDLEVLPGENLGVVGRSGSGKTTLVNLISRFYDVDEGRVTIDGHDVRDLARGDLCRHVGVVLQEPFLFRGSIWDNLVYGRPAAPAEDALAAARGGNCHDFVMRLPLAYDTPLGERGAGLSGGERQRLAIARTLLYDPKVLILDEATSSVDTESEKAIQDALAVLTRGRTTIAIAHRLSTLRNADRIVVMDQGRLIEEGSHHELMDQDGVYARLVRIQTHVSSSSSVDTLVAAGVRGKKAAAKDGRDGAVAVADGDGADGQDGSRRSPRRHWEEWRRREVSAEEKARFKPRWLVPETTELRRGQHGGLAVRVGEEDHEGVFAARCLPATSPTCFISLRYADADGHDHEIGLVRDLDAWPKDKRDLVESALARRYLLLQVLAVESIRSEFGLLTFRVQTDHGPTTFTMRNSHSNAAEYGPRGKLLIDVDDNRFVIPDLDALPRRQQVLFRRYIYW